MVAQSMDSLVSLSKRRGFIFQSNNIYGGLQGVYDFGPLGVELKKNIRQSWWSDIVYKNENIFGLDASILTHPLVLNYSGHEETFTDPLVDCKDCKARHRAYFIKDSKCPLCGSTALTEPRDFNLMFKTNIGPIENESNTAYLRPETAQGIYVNYLLTQNAMRLKIPFGIAQIGKAFRNEIVARNFIFRTREFEQLEMQYFIKPENDDKSMEYWKNERYNFYSLIGIDSNKIRLTEHGPNELAHYAKEAWDIEYKFPFGWSEVEGIHNRTDFDLRMHQEHSGKKMEIFDQESNHRYLPYIIETSAGLNRMMLSGLSNAFWEDTDNNRIVMKLHPKIAPVTAVVCPLTKKDGLPEIGKTIIDILKPNFKIIYDQQGSIGKRYYRQDEEGTPFGITVDHQSKEDHTVTIRDSDTQTQERIEISNLLKVMKRKIEDYT